MATAKSVTELTRDEQKMVNGGNYATYEECLADCPGTLTGDYGETWNPSCAYMSYGVWVCMDS